MLKRIVAISVIFACSWVAWAVLGLATYLRTDEKTGAMGEAVGELWGAEQTQPAPRVTARWKTGSRREVRRAYGGEFEYVGQDGVAAPGAAEKPGEGGVSPQLQGVVTEITSRQVVSEKVEVPVADGPGRPPARGGPKTVKVDKLFEVLELTHTLELPLAASDIDVKLAVDHRKKGLLWFATYGVDFASDYAVENPVDQPVEITVLFDFPSGSAVYDAMAMRTPGLEALDVRTEAGRLVGRFTLAAGAAQRFEVGYRSRGMDRWIYRFGEQVNLVRNFRLKLRTDFEAIDFPAGSISPDAKARRPDGGWDLLWEKESLVSGLQIGMEMPHRLNPGPLAASMSLHAPVSLFFFFFLIFILQALRDLKIHPMNYFFLAASFFSFNLLFAYLVDHVDLVWAFAAASAVSVFLVVSYLRIVVGARFAMVEAALAQLVYQVLFSLAHFLEGYTGLTVTIGAILTLAFVMRATARLDWSRLFQTRPAAEVPVRP
jgi:hypothetical protein